MCSPSPARGTGWEQVEHLTVGRTCDARDEAGSSTESMEVMA